MCIILYVPDPKRADKKLINRIQDVNYDGRDGRGIGGLLIDRTWHLAKGVDMEPIEILAELDNDYYLNGAIIHLRTATAGTINELNTQPILSSNKRVLLAHNGDFTWRAEILLGFLKGISEKYKNYRIGRVLSKNVKIQTLNFYSNPYVYYEENDDSLVSDSWVLTEFIGMARKYPKQLKLAKAIYEMNVGNVVLQFRDGTVYLIGSFTISDNLITTSRSYGVNGYHFLGILRKRVDHDFEVILQEEYKRIKIKKRKKRRSRWKGISEFFTRYI